LLIWAERPEQVALEGGGDGGGDRSGRHRGERLDRDHVAGHDEPDDLRADEVGSEGPVLAAEQFGCGAEKFAAEELAQHACDLGLAGGGAHDAGEALMQLGLFENVDEERGKALADRGAVAGEDRREHLGGVERQADRGDEQLLLGAEEVRDQLLVDARLGRDSAQGGAVIAVQGELASGGGEDRFARSAPAGRLSWRPAEAGDGKVLRLPNSGRAVLGEPACRRPENAGPPARISSTQPREASACGMHLALARTEGCQRP
jgi:hypothetical protein